MTLVFALIVFVLVLAGIIYAIVAIVNHAPKPNRGDGVWRVTTRDLANDTMVGVYVSRGTFEHKIDAVRKDALDFSDQLRALRGDAQVKADQWNEAEAEVKVLSTTGGMK